MLSLQISLKISNILYHGIAILEEEYMIWLKLISTSLIIFSLSYSGLSLSKGLKSIVVEVNGEPQVVLKGESLTVVEGDSVTVKSGQLVDGGRPLYINVIGFGNKNKKEPWNDIGYAIKTDTDFDKAWSVGKRGKSYRVKALSSKVTHGIIYIKLAKPELRYAVVTINGETTIVREGNILELTQTDKIKVQRVVTNIKDDRRVAFKIVPVPSSLADGNSYQILLLNGTREFARIPMNMKWVR